MWTSREEAAGSTRNPAELVVMEGGAVAAAMPSPAIANLNVTKSSKVHIGPKFVSVTQNVQNAEMLKGRFLGLDLVSTKQARRLRCSVAVFVCWAFLVASGLIIYLIYIAMPSQRRLDISLNQTWYLRRGDWQAMRAYEINFLQLPVSNVIVGHTASNYCNQRYKCIEQMLVIQEDHLRRNLGDIGPNFLVGGSGLVFEGRGANVCGAMVASWNSKSITIMFMGNYLNDETDTEQFDHVNSLLDVLVQEGVLRRDYSLFELPLPKYLWHIIKNSTRTERLSCAAALALLLICVGLIGYFSSGRLQTTPDTVDRAPHAWNISREMWLAKAHNYTLFTDHYEPLMLVVVQNTVGPQCHRFDSCAAELRNLQNWYLKDHGYDIPYNFAVGNDGRVYENRGWQVVGAHTLGFNGCSIGLGFLGDYREEMPNHASLTKAQENHTLMLLEEGVRLGHLRRDFLVVGGRDLTSTASPGSNLYNGIRRWRNYDHQARFKGLTCEQIHQKYGNVPLYDVDAL